MFRALLAWVAVVICSQALAQTSREGGQIDLQTLATQEGVPQRALARFLAASVAVQSNQGGVERTQYYDALSSCVLDVGGGNATFLRAARPASDATATQISLVSLQNLLELGTGTFRGAEDMGCASEVAALFGEQFDRDYRQFSVLRRDTEGYIDRPAGLADRSLPSDRRDFLLSRLSGVREQLSGFRYLGAFTESSRVILIFGALGSPVRWLSQYNIVQNGVWELDLGVEAYLVQ